MGRASWNALASWGSIASIVGVAINLVGCPEPSTVDPCTTTLLCVDAGQRDGAVGDGGSGNDAGRDAFVAPDTGPEVCSSPPAVGRVGGFCDRGECTGDLSCLRAPASNLSVRTGFGIRQGTPVDPSDPSEFTAVEVPDPAQDAGVTFLTPALCTEPCDATLEGDDDTCGDCATCSQEIGNDNLGFPTYFFLAETPFEDDTGICRANCEFDPETNGGCPDGYTCDPRSNICIEACANDAQCSAVLVYTEGAELVSWIVPDTGLTCNTTTGRCDWAPTGDPNVGSACEGMADCAADTGFCLNGGTCAELQCAGTAPEFLCDDGRGVCLPFGGNNGTICIDGCNTADDCQPGNACLPLGSAGATFSGYCLGICDVVQNGSADQIITCSTARGEQCDMDPATDEDPDPSGSCRTTCVPGGSDCGEDEICQQVEGQEYGFCRTLGLTCETSDECLNGQICNDVITPGFPFTGRCMDPCTTESCGEPTVCVTTGELTGLCATPCNVTTGPTVCGEGRRCQIPLGMTEGYCTEMP